MENETNETKQTKKLSVNTIRQLVFAACTVTILVACFFVLRAVSSVLVQRLTASISEQNCKELNEQMTSHIYSSLDHYFDKLDLARASLSAAGDLTEEKVSRFIADIQNTEHLSYMAFADTNGMVYDANGSYLGTMQLKALGKLYHGENRVVSEDETIYETSCIVLGLTFDTPIQMGDTQLCYGFVGLTPESIMNTLVLSSSYSGSYSSIIASDGSFIIKNPLEKWGGVNIFTILRKYAGVSDDKLEEIHATVDKRGSYLLTVNESDSSSLFIYFSPIENTQWMLVNTLPDNIVRASVTKTKSSLNTITLGIIFVILLLFLFILRIQAIARRKLDAAGKELEIALQQAKSASQAKTAFLFNMSHDIRTPMNAILGYTDICLAHSNDKSLADDSFGKIKSAGEHLLNLINDILEMSRIEAGKLELHDQPMDMRNAIATVTQLGQSLALPKSIDFSSDTSGIRNHYIYADELHINEVILNLLSNAVKYTPDGGKVRYTATQLTDPVNGIARYRFEIADTGIGMSEEFQRHLFEAFSRERTATVSKTEGAGLGLSIVKKIVDLAGGTVSATSASGKGSTFVVELPFKVMDEEAIKKFEAERSIEVDVPAEDTSLEGKKVLLVEDNELNREIATYILEEAGLAVDTAEDGDIAVHTVYEKGTAYYDFILMDIQMPVMDGYEATRQIRDLPDGKNVPIIALSANAFEEDMRKSRNAGMDAHIAKPINVQELLDAMRKVGRK